MDLKLIDAKGQAASTMAASDALFARDYNEPLIHQVVTAYQANARQGTRAQKGRSEIAKSTRKPWRQKGTGRARAGMASSPLWRGGGRIFPSSPDENFTQKLNRKMYRAGVASILSQLARETQLANNPRRLTARENEILNLLGLRYTNQEIADHLFLSRETIRWHLRSLYSKIGASDRAAAIQYAQQRSAGTLSTSSS